MKFFWWFEHGFPGDSNLPVLATLWAHRSCRVLTSSLDVFQAPDKDETTWLLFENSSSQPVECASSHVAPSSLATFSPRLARTWGCPRPQTISQIAILHLMTLCFRWLFSPCFFYLCSLHYFCLSNHRLSLSSMLIVYRNCASTVLHDSNGQKWSYRAQPAGHYLII